MKKLSVILLIIFTGLLLFSCKPSTSPEEDFNLRKDIVASFSNYNDYEETYAAISILQSITGDVSLKVNGVECELDFDYSVMGRVFHFFIVDYIEFGSTFNYEIQVGNELYSGSIKHPDKYDVNFPEFDIDRDFAIDWTLASNPQYQFLDYYLGAEDDWDDVSDVITLKPSARSYTLRKNTWSSLDNARYVDFVLTAQNIKRHGSNCVVHTYSDAFYDEYHWEDWKTNKDELPKGLELIMKRHIQ
ncbi:MAG: hypothetical protein LHW60_06715 [Candidatus Cloacimonetes bacterium]|nr:hypothetical protein [Candidatus Cloacimonadota bacterium]